MDKVKWQEIADSTLDRARDIDIEDTEVVTGTAKTTAPTSVRLSTPLLKRLDQIAAEQNRKRGNLIQHILWEYVRTQRQSTSNEVLPSRDLSGDAYQAQMVTLGLALIIAASDVSGLSNERARSSVGSSSESVSAVANSSALAA
jgi:hypothetical protein